VGSAVGLLWKGVNEVDAPRIFFPGNIEGDRGNTGKPRCLRGLIGLPSHIIKITETSGGSEKQTH